MRNPLHVALSLPETTIGQARENPPAWLISAALFNPMLRTSHRSACFPRRATLSVRCYNVASNFPAMQPGFGLKQWAWPAPHPALWRQHVPGPRARPFSSDLAPKAKASLSESLVLPSHATHSGMGFVPTLRGASKVHADIQASYLHIRARTQKTQGQFWGRRCHTTSCLIEGVNM